MRPVDFLFLSVGLLKNSSISALFPTSVCVSTLQTSQLSFRSNASNYMGCPLSLRNKELRSTKYELNLTQMFSTPPKRVVRRNLKKRSTKRSRNGKRLTPAIEEQQSKFWENSETRPLVRSRSVEAGEDYWIDESDLQKSLQREQAIKNRKATEGEITQEKLRTEVVAPYKQNWIGFFSVGIFVLSTVIAKFPELLQSPVIPIPDL